VTPPDSGLGRGVLIAMIPVNLVMLAWVWFGRLFFGAGGWFLLILLYVLPFVFLALGLTTLLGFLRSPSPKALTRSQAIAQLTVWGGMWVFGFFLVDFGDADGSDLSAFTQVVGRNDVTLSISWTFAVIGACVAVLAWVVMLVLLLVQRREPRPAYGGATAQPRPGRTSPLS
jgi:hypothetical protein